MKHAAHDRAEILAGAIALGEATDAQLIEYRAHLAACPACLQAFGGEHELRRAHERIGAAREDERWQPDITPALFERMNARGKKFFRYSAGFLGVALMISLGGHMLVGGGLLGGGKATSDPLVINYDGARIVLERRSTRDAKPVVAAAPRMVVLHNIVQLHPQSRVPKHVTPPATQVAAVTVPPAQKAAVTPPRQVASANVGIDAVPAHPAGNAQSNVPPWRRADASFGSRKTLAEASTQFGSTHAAESIAVAPRAITIAPVYSTREVEPEGGETALSPQLPAIAYSEGAEGTAAFEVTVDETGKPVNCVVTKGSGWLVLDKAACKAAMAVHYKPKMVNGRAVQGIYRDAFTFRSSQQE